MKKVLVLGIGNRMMGDDGIGVHVAEALGQSKNLENVRLAVGETDTEFCLNLLEDADELILLDGANLGEEPGTVKTFPLNEVLLQRRSALSFHDFDLIHAMNQENIRKDGILITIEICSLSFSMELSPLLRERFSEIVREVEEIIAM